MPKLDSIKSVIAFCLIVVIALASFSADAVIGQADPFVEIKEKLEGISDEEKEILQNLFTLAQEIELMELEEKELAQGIEAINLEIKGLEDAIAEGELAYEKKQESLKRVLKSYQRMGPGSFLEIILDSDSLSTFLQRMNTLRDLTRNTGELLAQLEVSREKLTKEKTGLTEKIALIQERQQQARAALTKKMELKAQKEEYLASLKGEKEHYQEYLSNIENVWNEIKPMFSSAAKDFSQIIQEGNLPTDALEITFSLMSIKGAINDKVINEVIAEQSSLPQMLFAFHPGLVEISLPEKNLVLSGTFIILEGHTLKFQPKEGSFYGMPLEPGAIEELFSEGDLLLNLEPLLAGNSVNALEVKEGYLELINKLDLF